MFSQGRSADVARLEKRVDEIVQQLADSNAGGSQIQELRDYINNSLDSIEAYQSYRMSRPQEGQQLQNSASDRLDLLISKPRTRGSKLKGRFPNPFRIVISLLLITLGFAMIVMPAPPYFEMYTIFYFNANDGFTLMDLISLIIVFCGIFTLIMTMQKHYRD